MHDVEQAACDRQTTMGNLFWPQWLTVLCELSGISIAIVIAIQKLVAFVCAT